MWHILLLVSPSLCPWEITASENQVRCRSTGRVSYEASCRRREVNHSNVLRGAPPSERICGPHFKTAPARAMSGQRCVGSSGDRFVHCPLPKPKSKAQHHQDYSKPQVCHQY
jgi:hypothetical protein